MSQAEASNVVPFSAPVRGEGEVSIAKREGCAAGAAALAHLPMREGLADAVRADLDATAEKQRQAGRSSHLIEAWCEGYVDAVAGRAETIIAERQAVIDASVARLEASGRENGAIAIAQLLAEQPPGFDPECIVHRRIEATVRLHLQDLRERGWEDEQLDAYRAAFMGAARGPLDEYAEEQAELSRIA